MIEREDVRGEMFMGEGGRGGKNGAETIIPSPASAISEINIINQLERKREAGWGLTITHLSLLQRVYPAITLA